ETYIAASGFSGDYEVTIRRIWGRPMGSKAKLVIVKHQGTPDETRQEEVIRFDRTHTLKVKLEKGRRTSLAAVPPPGSYRRPENKSSLSEDSRVLVKLRDLADGDYHSRSETSAGMGGAPLARPGKVPLRRGPSEETVYQTGLSPFLGNSVDMTAQAT